MNNFIINSTAIENDPNSDDVGSTKIQITPQNLRHYLDEKIISSTVEVYETNGNGAENTAICEFQYQISEAN